MLPGLMIEESFIDYMYRKLLFNWCDQKPKIIKSGFAPVYKMECPLCLAKGAKLAWLPDRRTWKFLCSTKSSKNCQSQMEFPVFLKVWCRELFFSYQQERLEAGTVGKGFNCPPPEVPRYRRSQASGQ